jgi:hypothetical protein
MTVIQIYCSTDRGAGNYRWTFGYPHKLKLDCGHILVPPLGGPGETGWRLTCTNCGSPSNIRISVTLVRGRCKSRDEIRCPGTTGVASCVPYRTN